MLVYLALSVVTLFIQLFLHKKIKYKHHSSFEWYCTWLIVFSFLWPITIVLISVGVIMGFAKANYKRG